MAMNMSLNRSVTPLLLLVGLAASASAGEPIVVREGLVLANQRQARRAPIVSDPIIARIIDGSWTPPQAGDSVTFPDGQARKWEPIQAQADGFHTPPGAYLAVDAVSPVDQVMILEASAHGTVYVGGEPRVGDPYATGYVRIPVNLRKGSNPLLFAGSRGRPVTVQLVPARASAVLNVGDVTTPDLVEGEPLTADAAVVVLNATDAPRDGLVIVSKLNDGAEVRTPVPPLLPLSVRKVRFGLQSEPAHGDKDGQLPLEIRLVDHGETESEPLDSAVVMVRVRPRPEARKHTFVSKIDGSVQYYGLVPAAPGGSADADKSPGLILTLHGASVEAIGQAASYRPKPGLHIVAPTNRRPYGFDWEDWGRQDAIEVLELAQATLQTHPRRTYLTGHSMGGHGTWHLGVTFPDRFAAVAPSAGWISMFSYAGASKVENPEPVEELLTRATSPSDTLTLVRNLVGRGVYILHGDADDNVPVAQARTMREELGKFHPDFAYYERPGAGHWWGSECVDWPPLIAFLNEHESPSLDEVKRVDFVTANPRISARAFWAVVEAQTKAMRPSAVHLTLDGEGRRFSGETQNVSRLALDVSGALPKGPGPVDVQLDGQTLTGLESSLVDGRDRLWLTRSGGTWSAMAAPPSMALKGPHRSGPFKEAFRDRFLFVYGTQGTPEENAWSLARARYDSEVFWYRGNGSVDVVSDQAFLDPARVAEFRDRGVIVYGHAQSNGAWSALLADSPVQVERGKVRIGGKALVGDDLACLFLRPRPGGDVASVGVVAGSGLAGLRLTQALPYFVSGLAYPDCSVFRASDFAKGDACLRAAGYFGEDWGVDSGEFAWKD